MDSPGASPDLRKRLLQLPAAYGFQHERIKEMCVELRQILLQHATEDSRFLSLLFRNVEDRFELIPKGGSNHAGKPCVRKLGRGELTYRCLTCSLDDNCVLCKYCFNPDDHEGHNVFVKISNRDDGGICDCGDEESWTRPLHCLAGSGGGNEIDLPEGFANALLSTVRVALDFCIDVISTSHPGIQFFTRPQQFEQNARESEFYPGDLNGGGKYILSMWHDEKRSYNDCYSDVELSTGRPLSFARMLAHHLETHGRATLAISTSLEFLLHKKSLVKHFACSIRTMRDYFREEMADVCLRWILEVAQGRAIGVKRGVLADIVGRALLEDWNIGNPNIDRASSARTAFSSGLDERSSVFGSGNSLPTLTRFAQPAWAHALLDGSQVPVLRVEPQIVSPPPPPQPLYREESDVEVDGVGIRLSDVVAEEELSGPESVSLADPVESLTSPIWRVCGHPRTGSERVRYLIFFDIRLWRSLRTCLTDLYVAALITSPEHKARLGDIYADLYPQIAEMYVLIDREPEVNVICSLSTQLFTTASIATRLISTEDIFSRYLAALYSLFTKHQVGPPQSVRLGVHLALGTPMFRNRRLGQLFHELEFLLERNTRKEFVVASPRRMMQTADFLSLFQGLSPLKRQTEKHVEYENESWVYFFTTIPSILQLSHAVAEGVSHVPLSKSVRSINLVALSLGKWSKKLVERLRSDLKASKLVSLQYAGNLVTQELSVLTVHSDLVSLHHPVTAFLSCLVQYAPIPDVETLRMLLFGPDRSDFEKLLLFDPTMRTLAFLSEVYVGLWVRNGYTVRSQLHHYRESTLRDIAYSRDIFWTQVALIALDPTQVFMALLDRWDMMSWSTDPLFDDTQRIYMLEEFLHTLSYLLVDRVRLQGDDERTTKRNTFKQEIIQCLGFGPMSYGDLVSQIPDSMASDEAFDSALLECATFRPPKGLNDVGIYALKPELLAYFDSHYTHYSLARIEEAEKIFGEPSKTVHCPILLPLKGMWSDLGSFTRTLAFGRFVSDSLTALMSLECESAISSLLYLLLMAAQNDLTRPSSDGHCGHGICASFTDLLMLEDSGMSILQKLSQIFKNPALNSQQVRCHKLFSILHGLNSSITVPAIPAMADDHLEKKRKKGREMQKKVLQDFERQQQRFVQSHDAEFESEEEPGVVEDAWRYPANQCVMCRMPDVAESIFGIMTFSSGAQIHRRLSSSPMWTCEGMRGSISLDSEPPAETFDSNETYGPAYPQDCTRPSTLVGGCGHGIHYSCFVEFQRTARSRAVAQLARFSPENVVKQEFLCPLCRGLNNGFMPVLWTYNRLSASQFLGAASDNKLLFEPVRGDISRLRSASRQDLQPKFSEALDCIDRLDQSFSKNVHEVLLTQMLRIKDVRSNSSPKFHGLQPIFSALAETLSAREISLRGIAPSNAFGGIIVDQLPTKTTQLLRVFSKYVSTLTGYVYDGCVQIRRFQQISVDEWQLPWLKADSDPLQSLIELVMVTCPLQDVSPQTALRSCYALCLLQTLRAFDESFSNKIGSLFEGRQGPKESVRSELLKWVPHDPCVVYAVLQRYATIFLRQASLFIFSLCAVYDADDFICMQNVPEHDRLSLYLGLPPLDDFILSLSLDRSAFAVVSEGPPTPLTYPGVYRLLRLPDRLDSFFNISDQGFSGDPAVCLFCGTIVRTQHGGACNEHIMHCAKEYGIYLLPRRNVLLLLLNDARGIFVPAPYLDLHGEPDECMRRGRPHYLQPKRYDEMARQFWLQNEIFSYVLRKLDQNSDNGGWETL